jgi:hypothetical protein
VKKRLAAESQEGEDLSQSHLLSPAGTNPSTVIFYAPRTRSVPTYASQLWASNLALTSALLVEILFFWLVLEGKD